jgi:hypothetical protein
MARGIGARDAMGGGLQAAHDHGQPTIVQSVEGAMFIEGRAAKPPRASSLVIPPGCSPIDTPAGSSVLLLPD